MNRQSLVGVAVVTAACVLGGCADTGAPPGPDGPALSLSGARGITADVQRTVTEISGGSETVLSVVDTTVWAPFDDHGMAFASAETAGLPGPVGWMAAGDDGDAWDRDGSFVDSAGVRHELWLTGKGRGVLRMRYRREGVTVMEYQATWASAVGGSVLDAQTVTFAPNGVPAVRVDVTGGDLRVASSGPFHDLLALGAGVTDLFRPQPLAAQFHFGACSKEWLTWGGGALLAEILWVKFLKTKSYSDFKRAVAATMAAGVALGKLVDCMDSQPEQPDSPG